jgi:hypothetical protein
LADIAMTMDDARNGSIDCPPLRQDDPISSEATGAMPIHAERFKNIDRPVSITRWIMSEITTKGYYDDDNEKFYCISFEGNTYIAERAGSKFSCCGFVGTLREIKHKIVVGELLPEDTRMPVSNPPSGIFHKAWQAIRRPFSRV